MRKISQILLFIVLILFSYQQSYAFDWNKICEFLGSEEKVFFQSKQDGVYLGKLSQSSGDVRLDFSTKANVTINFTLLEKYNPDNLSFELWDEKFFKWKKVFINFRRPDNSSGNVELTFEKEGLYRISTGKSVGNAAYLLVVDDIPKSLRKYLAKIKKDLELNPDAELYRSAILVSKINGLFQKLEEGLTLDYAKKLSQVFQEFHGLKKGKCPELTPGLYKIQLRRFPGAYVLEYVLRVPESYDAKTKSLLIFHPDIARFDERINYSNFADFIALWCHCDTSKVFFKDEFEYLFAIINKKLNIDSNRIHIVGKCRNGIDAIGLALQYPDLWAGCYASLGNNRRELSINAFNMHLKFSNANFYEGRADKFGYYNFMVKCFEYSCCPDADYNIREVPFNSDIIKRDSIRNESTPYIQYRTNSLKRGRAYWISIDGRNDEGLFADIKAKVVGNVIYVDTDNVESYSIMLDKSPVEGTQISIIETKNLRHSIKNDMNLDIIRRYDCDLTSNAIDSANSDKMLAKITHQKKFKRFPEKYSKSRFIKSPKLSGGINDVFAQRFVVVCPYIKDKKSVYTKFAKNLASGAPCYGDFESARNSFDTHNIVFVGTFEDYSALPEKLVSALPYKVDGKTIKINGKDYSGNQGVFSVYPNPFSPGKYLGIYICNSVKAASQLPNAFMKLKNKPEIDLGVFRIRQDGQFEWPIAEKLDTTWNYHAHYSDILANVGKSQEWRWKAWRADVIRKQIKADMGLFENCFNRPGRIPEGIVTKRDIYSFFNNTWIVKIEVNGTELKKILTVPFMNKDKRQLIPEISGVSFMKDGKAGQLRISDIEDEETYTLACPQKCLNGTRIGLCPKNYKIVDDGFAVEMILDYLTNMENDKLDEELAEQIIRIM